MCGHLHSKHAARPAKAAGMAPQTPLVIRKGGLREANHWNEAIGPNKEVRALRGRSSSRSPRMKAESGSRARAPAPAC